MTILSHLISCASWSTDYSFAHLPKCISSCPSYLAIFLGFFSLDSHSFHHFTVKLCHPPPLHFTTTFLYFIRCCYLFPLLLIFQLHFLTFFPYFPPLSFLFSFLLHVSGATYVWPFSVILWLIFEDFCTLQFITILHLIYDTKCVYISSLFLQCVGNN